MIQRVRLTVVALTLFLFAQGHVMSYIESNTDSIQISRNLISSKYLTSGWSTINSLECLERVSSTDLVRPHHDSLQMSGRNVRALVNDGRSAWIRGECDVARMLWEAAVNLQPADNIVWLYLGLAQYTTGHKDSSIQSFRNAGASEYLMLQGSRALEARQLVRALNWFDLAATTKTDMRSVSTLALVYIRLGRRSEAIASWQHLASLTAPDSSDHWMAVGEAASLQEDWVAAVDAYRRGAALAQNPSGFLIREGEALGWMGDLSSAAQIYRELILARPNEIWGYVSLGDIERQQRHYDEALSWLHKAESVDPTSVTPKLELGKTYLEQGRYDEADRYLFAAWLLAPHERYVPYFLAQSKHGQSEVLAAIGYLQQALALDGGVRWDWYVLLGDWYVETGDWVHATDAYRRALALNPDDTVTAQKLKRVEP